MVYIFVGGPIHNIDFVRQFIEKNPPAVIICADGGTRHAKALGLNPDMIVGDLDSIDPEVERHFRQRGVSFLKHPKKKDETDAELALEQAFKLAPDKICIFGGLGLRLDHTLANLFLLLQGLRRGIPLRLVDEWCEVFLVERTAVIEGEPGQTVSFFPFVGEASGINLDGFEYPLQGAMLMPDKPYGISNRLTGKYGTVSVETGVLLAIHYHREGMFPEGNESL
ncbi:MAG: thiamine diphosphokinase [Syntrophales bacterium]